MKVLIQALLAFIFVQQWVPILEGQSTGSGAWTTFTCDRKKNAILFTIKIGNCNIIPSGLPCFMDLIDRMVLQGCSSKDADSYVCNISSSYTGDPPCCVSRFIDGRTSNSCESMDTTQSTTEPAASTQSTTLTQGTTEPAVPIVIKFQPHEYEVMEGSNTQVCLVITNGTVLSGITIDVHLDPSTEYNTCREVDFPEGATVGDHQCITFPNTSLQAGQYRLVVTPPEDSPSDSARFIIHEKENVTGVLDWVKGLTGGAAVAVIMIFGGGCAVYIYYLIRRSIFSYLDWALRTCSATIGISNEQTVDNAQRPETMLYSRRPVQERGNEPPGLATRRGNQDTVEQSDVQREYTQIFPNLMGKQEEDANCNYNNTHPVCVELPVTHGSTQPNNGSSTSGSATVYLRPTHTKPSAVLNTTTILVMEHT